MKHLLATAAIAIAAIPNIQAQQINISQSADTTIVTINNPSRYLILPIEEERDEVKVMLDRNQDDDVWMDVRLAISAVDYEVPFELTDGEKAVVKMIGINKDALALKKMYLSDTWTVENTDYYRPLYHHTPSYGWMNDANGLVYKDGEYHLYFQYNPYGSKWGNMHWGHSVSRDLVHWTHCKPAIERDTLGHIFSGSCVVDRNNTAGYGKNTIIAFYTSHRNDPDGQVQRQCMAYSTDNGRSFTKYEGNPVLTPFDGLRDFRDPKVFWYEPAKAWYMIVSADKNMRFYKSSDLKDWTYVSQWGENYGSQPNQFECPDFFPLMINGKQKWVMIVNINPGFVYGGSGTEYFIGDFDGEKFVCDDAPEVAKFLDFGKDHYATVTFSNIDNRVVAVPWMSNWMYANVTPNRQVRGANALPRELELFESNGKLYLSANVPEEVKSLRKSTNPIASVKGSKSFEHVLSDAMEIELDVKPDAKGVASLTLSNDKGERVVISINPRLGRVIMDRAESGLIDFGAKAETHAIELACGNKYGTGEFKNMGQVNAMNYVNDFALATWAPLNLCGNNGTYHLRIFIDRSSVELFVDGGRIAMTNLVFPTSPYTDLTLRSIGGAADFSNINLYRLGL